MAANIAKAIIAIYPLRLSCDYRIRLRMTKQTNSEACAIIDALGGTSAVAKLVEAPVSTVHSWRTIGIPQSRRSHLRLAAMAADLPVPDELTPSEARAA